MKVKNITFLGLMTLMLSMWVVGCLSSCNYEKHLQKEKIIVDSTSLKIKEDSIRYYKKEVNRLLAEIRELEYAEVKFDTVFIEGDTMVNTVIVREDGTIKASGKIKSLTITKDKLTRLINEQKQTIDSLSKQKQQERIEYRTVTQTKTVEKKVRFIPWYVWIIMAVILGFYIKEKL